MLYDPLRRSYSLLLGVAILPLDSIAAPLNAPTLIIRSTDGGTDKQLSVTERLLSHFILSD